MGYAAAATAAKSLQSCPTLCDPTDGSPPGSPIPGILQARTLEWVAVSFSSAWKWKVKVKSLSRVQLLGPQPRLLRPLDLQPINSSVCFPGGSAVKNLPTMQELQEWQVRSLGQKDPLEEGLATHSSILAWKIPRTEEPGGLQSIGSERVRNDSNDLACWHPFLGASQLASVVKKKKNLPAVQETQEPRVWSLGGEGSPEEGMETHSSILAWISPMNRGP